MGLVSYNHAPCYTRPTRPGATSFRVTAHVPRKSSIVWMGLKFCELKKYEALCSFNGMLCREPPSRTQQTNLLLISHPGVESTVRRTVVPRY